MDRDLVVIVDFGAQYAQLIARRVREAGVFSEILPAATRAQEVLARHPRGIILSGGPASVYEEGAPTLDPELWALGVPMLGICYGMQLMAHHLGGRVARGERREFGRACLEVAREDLLLAGIGTSLEVWMSHGDLILEPPPGFEVLARSGNAPVAVMADLARHLYGVQFHPEVVHTARGKDILANFLFRICGCRPGWNAASFIDEAVGEIRAQVGDGRAVCALSGGVDSSVAAALTHRAVGDRLTCVFVDTGLLRAGEPEQVEATFSGTFGIPLIHVRAADRFLDALAGVTDPEAKRRKVGELFIRIFEEEATRVGQLGRVDFLVQGTVYPDVIESGTGTAATIKTHHNVGGLPARMALKLVEPLRWLFKDEVRAVGEALGLPSQLVWRHPFPGPGLAVRIIGEVTPEKLAVVRAADAIVGEEVERAGWYRRLWQAFAVLCDTRTVGVLGDARAYGYTVAVRAVISDDAMTADWARLPCEVLERISSRIVNEVPAVNRVVYDITSKPPATIEWE